MPEQAWFIPGRLQPPEGPLARYRPAQPVGAVGPYVQYLTRPGDLVVDLFCQGPTAIREIVAAGRRALGLSVNPLLLLAARMGLSRPDAPSLRAAFTRLADSPKGDLTLQRHLTLLYRSACPTCKAPGVAVWFAWDRDGGYPFKKAVRCPRCTGVQEGEADDQDIQTARRIPPRGLAYYYALDRAAPSGHPARERTAELLELYTPRNLSALMDLALRLAGLEADREAKMVLAAALLECCDACASLDHYNEPPHRSRTLRIPPLYLERNVWLWFEECFSRLLAAEPPAPLCPATDITGLVRGEAPGYALASHAARDVQKVVRPASVALIVADPPRPDAAFWALAALWACWLWDTPAAHAMRPFLRRRRFDWEWHWRVLRMALSAAGPLLTADGHLVTLFYEHDVALLESLTLAASGAGYTLVGWGYSLDAGYRLVWRWQGVQPSPPTDPQTLEQALGAAATEAAVSGLRARGEPAAWPLVHASVHAELTRRRLLAQAAALPEGNTPPFAFTAGAVRRALDAAPLMRLTDRDEGTLWWLADVRQVPKPAVSRVEPPLADRVEARVRELLLQRAWSADELVNAVYAGFPGPLTPDLALVLACVDSYGVLEGGTWCLRLEDEPTQRATELRGLRQGLNALGKRLEFEVKRKPGWDVRWLEKGREVYVFVVSPTAALGDYLLTDRAVDEGAQRCLVLPGGRAQLVTFKLQRDPRLRQAVEQDRWQFIKFRHLRRLLAEEKLDRYAFKTVLGLDPIVEREAAQIPLF